MRWQPRERRGNRYTVQRKCGGIPTVRRGLESVRDTTLATLGEQSRRQVGPKNLFGHPARDPHPLVHQISPMGWPRGGEYGVRAAWQNFSIGGGGQVLTVRERRSNRDAMAAPRAAWESVGRATENAAAGGAIGTQYNGGDAG